MFRFSFCFLLTALAAAPAWAETQSVDPPAIIWDAPPDEQNAAPQSDAQETVEPVSGKKWTALPLATRRRIVAAWSELDEMTRPPFPIFRDQWLKNEGDAQRPAR